ncbi:MAG TPA: flagellar assembly protein FliX [Acetobacteraceae bacterium]|nr:flagellar assembly protein FliX [Acetobacteraceae bacterium]
MLMVSGLAPAAAPSRTARRPGIGGFSVALDAPPEGSPVAGPAAMALDTLLTLQQDDAASSRDGRARRHGQSLLEELAALQRALLEGGADAGGLERLAALTASVPDAADPRLRAVMQAVVLRARVELARRAPR